MPNRNDIVTVFVDGKPVKRKAFITRKGFLGLLGLKHLPVESVTGIIFQFHLMACREGIFLEDGMRFVIPEKTTPHGMMFSRQEPKKEISWIKHYFGILVTALNR